MTIEDMITEFQTKFDAKDPVLYLKLMKEEAKEVREAAQHLLKELADFAYVVNGAGIAGATAEMATELGLEKDEDILKATRIFLDARIISYLLETAFVRVHKSNMSKLDDDGKPVRREDGKVLKGPNYLPPDLTDLL